jgi:hypothetical protein
LKKNFEYDRSKSLDEKEALLNAAIRKEIIRRSGVPYAAEATPADLFTHPLIRYEMFAVVGALVDMILPETIIDSIGLYTDVKQIGFGDSAAFDVAPRDLFVVSKAGRAQKNAEVHKQYKGQVTVTPENRQIDVAVSMYKVLSGIDSLAELVMKAARSIETQVTLDAYNAFATAMAGLDATATTGLYITGYSQANIVRLCQQVQAWNQGAKPVIVGTQLALVNVLPDDANYRYDLQSDFVKIGYLRTAFGYDVMALPQVADITTQFGRAISDSYLWVLSPSTNKLLKLVLEGQILSFTDGPFDRANLEQKSTMQKAWGVAVATNSIAGTIAV